MDVRRVTLPPVSAGQADGRTVIAYRSLVVPVLNLNGTAAADLIGAHSAALEALRVATSALELAMPHPRDFQVYPDQAAFAEARDQHLARLRVLRSVYVELEAIALDVSKQSDERRT